MPQPLTEEPTPIQDKKKTITSQTNIEEGTQKITTKAY